ncbi:MAG: helix-turn-helix transcriptional regulator [Clostridia bacterium]|nr:helix-turn-helix transcriptional regulator [Clostridia bacterium]
MAFIEIEKSVHKNDWSMQDLHSHPHYEIYLLQKGKRSFFLSNALIELEAPSVIVIPPHTLHKTEGGPFERYNVNVSPNYLDEFQRDVLHKKSLHILKPTQQESKRLQETLEEAMAQKNNRHGEWIVKALFSYGIVCLNAFETTYQKQKPDEQNPIPPLILKVIDYLHKNYGKKHTLDSLAEQFFVSKGTLSYTFRKYMDCSLIDFLLSIRIAKAKELLLATKKSVEEISEQCGFSSANYFGLIFKQKEKLSPINYRKHQQNKS